MAKRTSSRLLLPVSIVGGLVATFGVSKVVGIDEVVATVAVNADRGGVPAVER